MYIAIVDDLESDRCRLKEILRQYCIEKRIPCEFLEYTSGEAFLQEFRPGLCSVLFLDILMGGISGMETAGKVRETDKSLPIVFTTTEAYFALGGYQVHAMDYLVKPVSREKLEWCMDILLRSASAPAYLEVREITGQGVSRPVKLLLDEIFYFRSEGHNVVIRTLTGTVRVRSPFREVMAQVPQSGRFFECGRGIAVNFEQCQEVRKGALRMKNGEILQFSMRQQESVEKAYMRYIFSRTRGVQG